MWESVLLSDVWCGNWSLIDALNQDASMQQLQPVLWRDISDGILEWSLIDVLNQDASMPVRKPVIWRDTGNECILLLPKEKLHTVRSVWLLSCASRSPASAPTLMSIALLSSSSERLLPEHTRSTSSCLAGPYFDRIVVNKNWGRIYYEHNFTSWLDQYNILSYIPYL